MRRILSGDVFELRKPVYRQVGPQAGLLFKPGPGGLPSARPCPVDFRLFEGMSVKAARVPDLFGSWSRKSGPRFSKARVAEVGRDENPYLVAGVPARGSPGNPMCANRFFSAGSGRAANGRLFRSRRENWIDITDGVDGVHSSATSMWDRLPMSGPGGRKPKRAFLEQGLRRPLRPSEP